MKNSFLVFLLLIIINSVFGQVNNKIKIPDPDTIVIRLGQEYMKQPSAVGAEKYNRFITDRTPEVQQ